MQFKFQYKNFLYTENLVQKIIQFVLNTDLLLINVIFHSKTRYILLVLNPN